MVEVKTQNAKGKTTRQKSKLSTLLNVALWFCLLTFAFCLRASACPGCKEALFDPGQVAETVGRSRGYAWSILLMLAVPCLLLGAVTGLLLQARRKAVRSGIDTPKLSR
jgi:hypothetical protein